jgi:hypothetical protein
MLGLCVGCNMAFVKRCFHGISFWAALIHRLGGKDNLIADLHNSNKPTAQTTLLGEIIPEEKYSLLGFVKGDDLQIEENTCL